MQQHMSSFQNGGTKGKGVVDNLFILRALFDHAKYLNKELWLTFYDIEKLKKESYSHHIWCHNRVNV